MHGFVHRLPSDDAGGGRFDEAGFAGVDVPFTIHGTTQRVDDATDGGISHGNLGDFTGSGDRRSFLDFVTGTHQYGPDVIFFEVEGNTDGSIFKFEQFAGHGVFQAVDAGDAIANLQHGSDVGDFEFGVVLLDLLLDNAANFVWSDRCHNVCPSFFIVRW